METHNKEPRSYIMGLHFIQKEKKQYTVDEKINYKSSVA